LNEPTSVGAARIGLLGGSFDPVHRAHIALAEAAQGALHLAEVQLIPAANPWQRAPLRASGQDRCAMLRLAIAGHGNLALNTIEIDRGGPTYTVDTLRALPAVARYVWLLGADQLERFCTWHAWQEIVDRVDLAVATRPGASLRPPAQLAAYLDSVGRGLEVVPFPLTPVSASDIRERLAQDLPLDDMLNPQVYDYIRVHHLYRD
jgi:nicotinate-nucleotide adenylyltransferase